MPCQNVRLPHFLTIEGVTPFFWASSNQPSTQEGMMEIALIPGIFVGIFALGAAMILWFPYDA